MIEQMSFGELNSTETNEVQAVIDPATGKKDEFIKDEEEILPEIEEDDGVEVINFTDLFEDDSNE